MSSSDDSTMISFYYVLEYLLGSELFAAIKTASVRHRIAAIKLLRISVPYQLKTEMYAKEAELYIRTVSEIRKTKKWVYSSIDEVKRSPLCLYEAKEIAKMMAEQDLVDCNFIQHLEDEMFAH